jgi:1-acyl-sn-glycerol-3-phosphate acyltransferase
MAISNKTIKQKSLSRAGFLHTWQRFCRLVVRIFYRKFEITGIENIPDDVGLLFCANHVNALVDVVVLQAATSKSLRPLARSGLFLNPFLKPILNLIGAVPIYRRNDPGTDTTQNQDSFVRCYELLAQHETIIIFPEGQSHSDPHINKLKTGAARIALGAIENNPQAPIVLPVGLTFSRKGKFRSDVLVQFGTAVDLTTTDNADHFESVELITDRIKQELAKVTLNAESWEDIYLISRLEKFFALRRGKYRKEQLKERFHALQRLIDAQRILRIYEPDKVRTLVHQLRGFERLCKCCGIRDYHLTIKYKPLLVAVYIIRLTVLLLIGLPIATWGMINNFIPYQLTRDVAKRIAKGPDQYDTANVSFGMLFFLVFWIAQTYIVHKYFGMTWSLIYLLSVILSAPFALKLRKEYHIILDNVKIFFLFMRKKQLREYLETKRKEIEVELAKLLRIVKRLPTI